MCPFTQLHCPVVPSFYMCWCLYGSFSPIYIMDLDWHSHTLCSLTKYLETFSVHAIWHLMSESQKPTLVKSWCGPNIFVSAKSPIHQPHLSSFRATWVAMFEYAPSVNTGSDEANLSGDTYLQSFLASVPASLEKDVPQMAWKIFCLGFIPQWFSQF